MWKIIAALRGDECAILEKDGQLYFSWGSMMSGGPRKARPMSKHESDLYIQEDREFIRLDPPVEVANLDDWPEAALEYAKTHGILVPPAE